MSDIINPETGLPLRFPDWRQEAYERAKEFRRLSSTERFREIIVMMEFGLNMVRTSPRRQAIEKRWLEQETEWQNLQRKLFLEHAK